MKSAAHPARILQITDPHLLIDPGKILRGVNTDYYFRQILQHAIENHPHSELILLTGDLAEEPDAAVYQRIVDYLSGHSIDCACLPGNHDDYELMKQNLNHGRINCNKEFSIANWHIILLNSRVSNSQVGYLAEDEMDFLKKSLDKNRDKHVLIAVHHQCIATESLWLDTMQITNSDALFDLLSHYSKVRAIIFGHVHQQMDSRKNGMAVLGTPSTCYQFKPNSRAFALDEAFPSYRWLDLYPDGQIGTEVVYVNLQP